MEERKITTRLATMEDADILFNWKNEAATIANSLTQRGVTMEEHIRWLQGVLANENRHLYIMEVDGQPAGQFRLDIEDEIAEISCGLDESFRGQGLGTEILRQTTMAAEEKKVKEIFAEVLQHNMSCRSSLRSLGYEESVVNGIVNFRKKLR